MVSYIFTIVMFNLKIKRVDRDLRWLRCDSNVQYHLSQKTRAGRETDSTDTHPMNQSTVSRRYSGSRSSLTDFFRGASQQKIPNAEWGMPLRVRLTEHCHSLSHHNFFQVRVVYKAVARCLTVTSDNRI